VPRGRYTRYTLVGPAAAAAGGEPTLWQVQCPDKDKGESPDGAGTRRKSPCEEDSGAVPAAPSRKRVKLLSLAATVALVALAAVLVVVATVRAAGEGAGAEEGGGWCGCGPVMRGVQGAQPAPYLRWKHRRVFRASRATFRNRVLHKPQ
jgi:hypothetical protein